MLRALTGILFVAGIALGAWALLAADETPNQTTPGAEPAGAGQPAAEQTQAPAAPAQSDQAPAPSGDAAQAPAEGQTAGGAQPSAGAAAPDAAGGGGNPQEIAKSAEKGSLKSPYADFASVAEDGHQKFMAAGCNGCHGGGGGGGMGPPLTNEVWIYGKDDDTLFRLVALGSDELKKQGYARKGSENVVGPMPPMGGVLKSPDDVWKVIAWIRSVNPSSAGGSSASAPPPAQ
jgi:mono/diheme cytochrome c family protein